MRTVRRAVVLVVIAVAWAAAHLNAQVKIHPLPATVSPRLVQTQDLGAVADTLVLPRVVLWLGPTVAQQTALDLLLAQQQDPMSPNYHQWLTPEQYATRFGASPAQLSQVEAWGAAHQLTVVEVARGANYVAFRGTAAAVETALQLTIHRVQIGAELHFANVNEPVVPTELAALVTAITGLNDFRPQPAHKLRPRPMSTEQMSPSSLAAAYDLNPLYGQGITGNGETLVVVGQATVDVSDLDAFRSNFGVNGSDPTLTAVPNTTPPNDTEDLNEADLDLEWAEAVAPAAAINYVYADSAFDAAEYAIEQKLGSVVSVSFSACESSVSAADASTLRTAIQQGNSEGMTLVAASGDVGASACDAGKQIAATSSGLAVNLPASVPETTAIGGTALNGIPGSGGSYPGETTWNDTTLAGYLEATGGGVSMLYTIPSWQQGVTGMPAGATNRYLPDLAFAASPNHDPFPIISGGSDYNAGGTSVATPIFAASLMLLQQSMQANGVISQPGLGNINPGLYTLSANTAGVFHDITTGDNKVPCVAGSPDCPNGGTIGYAAGTGYDPATGLGSLDLSQFVFWWSQFAGKPQVTVSPSSLAFGSQDEGSSNTLTVIVANSGDGMLPIGTPAISGGKTSAFSVSSACPGQLIGGDQCTIAVTFKPTAAGSASDSLVIAGATTNIATIALSGSVGGPAAIVGPSEVYFPDQAVGTSSSFASVNIYNDGQVLLSPAASLTGTNAGDFVLSGSCPSVGPGGTCDEIQVLFKPTAAGFRTATLQFADAAADSPQSIVLSGDATGNTLVVNPVSLDLGSEVQGHASLAQVVTLSTPGTIDLSQPCSGSGCLSGPFGAATGTAGIVLGGVDPYDFYATSDCGLQLKHGTCHVTVWYIAGAPGTNTAALQISSPALSAPVTVTLTGTKTPTPVAQPASVLAGSGTVIVAGNGTYAAPTENALATQTSLGSVGPLATDSVGNLYIGSSYGSGYSGLVLKVTTGGQLLTIVAGKSGASSDGGNGGPATQAGIAAVSSLAVDNNGNIFINDDGAYLREVSAATGKITLLATDSINGTHYGAVATDAAGDLYYLLGCSVEVWNAQTQQFSVAAGDPNCQATGTVPGPAAGARIQPQGLAIDGSGNVWISDSISQSLLEIVKGQIAAASPAVNKPGALFGFDAAGDLLLEANGELTRDAVTNFANPLFSYSGQGAVDPSGNVYLTPGSDNVAILPPLWAPQAFAAAQVGATSTSSGSLTLVNLGNANLNVTSIAVQGPDAGDFTVKAQNRLGDGPCSSLIPGEECGITVGFTPTAVGDRTAQLVITDSAPGSPHTVNLTGTGTVTVPSYGITVAPSSLSFSQTVGTISAPQGFNVINSGTLPEPVTFDAQASSVKVDPGTCTGILPPQASCSASATFAPTVSGAAVSTDIVVSNPLSASGSAQVQVSITGLTAGADATLSPAALAFAVAAIGDASPQQLVTVTNTGSQTLTITGTTTTDPSDYKVPFSSCVGSIAPGDGCTLGITFNPGANGTKAAKLSVISNAVTATTVALSGATGAPTANLSTDSLTFAAQGVNNKSAAQTVTVSNNGAGALSVTSAKLSGANAGDFAESDTCAGASVAVKATCTVSVTFTPSALGGRSATLTLTDNAPDSPQAISLAGTGVPAAPEVTLAPASLTFAAQPTGTTSAAQTVTLTNSGNATLTISTIAASGDFLAANTCGASVAVGANCTITVTFTPTATGARTGAVTITDNAGDNPQMVVLSGQGVVAAVTLAPASLTFGSQATGAASAAQTITLSDVGTAAVNISAIAASGDFAATSNCGASVAAGSTCTIAVTFTPTTTGARSGTLTVSDDATGGTQTAALTGTGADLTVGPGSGSSASSTVTAGQPATYALAYTPVNGLTGTFAVTCTGAPQAATCTPTPASINLAGTAPAAVTITVTTTARSGAVPGPRPQVPWGPPPGTPWQWLLALGALAGLARAVFALRSRRRWLAPVCLAAALGLAVACGGGGGGASSSGGSGGGTAPTGTPAGTYTLTVTATDGAVVRATTLTLVVN